ncbi:MAG: sugar ABC transporter permease [Candidatus Wallbacteria bacterium]|nr:sugar ABC transporter permease [Candidatus Wallbacteria bacterium]
MSKVWKNKEWDAYLYLLPAVSIILFFHVMPIFLAAFVSLQEWDLMSPAKFVGLSNYRSILQSDEFYSSLKHTVYFSLGSVPGGILLALFIAILLNSKIKGLSFYRTLYFIPVITSINAVAIVWKWIYHGQYGLLNYLIGFLGFPSQDWLQDPRFAMPAIIMMSIWKGLGYNVVIFLAGLQNVPGYLYEAARIDGANAWERFRHVTWPLLSPVTYFVLVMSTISSFQVFAQVYMMTPNGGPMGSTTVIVFYLYQYAFRQYKFGYASALAFILFLIILTMTLLQKFFVEKKVHYS